jgi:DNA invertase Pin-like site-specific DNA recombinase
MAEMQQQAADEDRCYCDYRGFSLAHIYADIDHSGYTNSRARPALRELCDHRRKYAASS